MGLRKTDTQRRIEAAEGYLMLGEFAAAVEHYRAALKADPGDVPLSVGLARCLVRLGMTDAGLQALEAAYDAHPDDPELYYELARHHALGGDKVLALSWLGRAIRQSQDYRQRAADDVEFQQLRRDPDFEFLVQSVAES